MTTIDADTVVFPRTPTIPPAPGFHPGLAETDHHRWAAWSKTTLLIAGEWNNLSGRAEPAPFKSPRHLWAYLQGKPEEPSDSMRIGAAQHCLLLENHRFLKTYHVLRHEINKRTNDGKAEWAALTAAHGADRIITADEWEDMQGMARGAAENTLARDLLGAVGQHELSMTWDDEATGLRCKGRIDKYIDIDGTHLIVDLKTTRCSHPILFERDAGKLGYHVQAAMYVDGVKAITGREPKFIIVAVEKTDPYLAVVYPLRPEVIESGRVIYRGMLALIAECLRTGNWPGYADNRTVEMDVPRWHHAEVPDAA